MSHVYLDHAATTPMLPEAVSAMAEHLPRVGNASSLHASGRYARRVVEEARETIAAAVGCRPGEIVFTSGGTESDNIAIKGIYWARHDAQPERRRIVTSAVEHHAVLDPAHWLQAHEDALIDLAPVDAAGRLDLAAYESLLVSDPASVALVSVMWANNETGTVQQIPEIAEIAARFGVPMHSDAVQAVGKVPVNFASSGLDAMTFTGHKLGGPIGVGALVVRRDLAVVPLEHGGGQERDIRSGTLNVPAIAGFAVAVDLAVRRQAEEARRVAELRDELVRRIRAVVPDAIYNGDPEHRVPGNAHLTFPEAQGDSLLMLLDARGIECSTGSACSAGVAQPSHVLMAMGRDAQSAKSALRFTLGHTSTPDDVEALVAAIGPVVERARSSRARRPDNGRTDGRTETGRTETGRTEHGGTPQ